jgi:hypothetical protein
MKKQSLFILTIFLCLAPVVFADWKPGDPHKWLQNPDLTTNGIDIRMDNRGGQRAIGDDFLCTETGPITDVHLWVSWKSDVNGPISGITLSIYSNNPSGPGGFSLPDYLLWSRQFTPSQFTQRPDYNLPSPQKEGWWDPRAGGYIASGDSKIYQINININPLDAYVQEGSPTHPVIYWLVVEPQLPAGSTMFGWKTRSYLESHFMDDAVWRSTSTSPWVELKYPQGHPLYGASIDMAFVITSHEPNTMDFGDAPEGSNAIAYPATGVTGSFPTCKTIGPAGWVQHTNFGAYFGPKVDFEGDGNAGLCPALNCFPPYNQDECFNDGDAGLIVPQPYTIDALYNVIPCPTCTGSSLGGTCQFATWGGNIDINVNNNMPGGAIGYVNLLIDWNQDGRWGGSSPCPTAATPEHVLVNFPVPNGYNGPLSGLMPIGTGFLIGPYPDYVWARFSITDVPVRTDWDGEGTFEDGETEDYLLHVYPTMEPTEDYGDAPQGPYPTKFDKDGARHTVVAATFLGVQIDAEFDGQPDATATGDDFSNLSDEDGVAFTPIIQGTWSTVYITPSVNGYINAWMDFNADGDWDDIGERIFTDYFVSGGLTNACLFQVPFYASPNTSTFARFRYTTYVSLPPIGYTGLASDGEVEDYMVYIIENPAIKWLQLPDFSENGIDIKVDNMRVIADDFECKSYGLITDVHLWGSWKDPIVGRISNIHLSIHSDDPVGPGGSDPLNEYSKPDELLWEKDFLPNEFSVGAEIYLEDGEYWWDPAQDILIPEGDHTVWRIDINIPDNEAFKQNGSPEEPVIYWLDVKVETDPIIGGEFGWKTRKYPQHFMDDAVFDYESMPPRIWKELRYPAGHPYEPNSIDMAFVITGKDLKRPLKNLKWSQPPLEMYPQNPEPEYCGWNEQSWTQEPTNPIPRYAVADDFRCIGPMPVTSIHWWGSFLNWSTRELPPLMPTSWNIKFYANVPAISGGDPNYSHPGEKLWEITIPNDRIETELVGYDYHPEYPWETCFQHYVKLNPDEYFKQAQYLEDTNDSIYWLGITAIYPGDVVVDFPWGWKTRPEHWMDDAVKWDCREDESGEIICRFWPIKDIVWGNSMDVAFELDTDPNWVKWEQSYTGIRDWPHYNDELSMAKEHGPALDIIRQAADDWLCKRRTPVTSIVWWGSYFGYNYQPCSFGPVPNPPVKPDYFLITISTDVAANDPCNEYAFSHPGQKVWEYKANNYDEVLVGYDKQPEAQPGPPREAVFRYSVKLPEDKWFRQRKINQIYWISIMAVYQTSDPTKQWGWTNHKHFYNDDAVGGYWDYSEPEPKWSWEEIYDQTNVSADLSFMLFTDPNKCVSCADYNWSGLVEFKDYAVFALDWLINIPVGGYANGDLDCNGDVNYEDLKIFCQQWLQTCP